MIYKIFIIYSFFMVFTNQMLYGCQPENNFRGCSSSQLPEYMQIYNLGTVYYFGLGETEVDIKKACDLFEKAAKMNYGHAQFNIGNCYNKGEGRQKDINIAIDWYKKAVNNNIKDARIALGFLYLYNITDQKKHIEAISLLQQERKAGNVRASLILGTAYYKGLGISKNYKKAIELYEEAAKKGNSMAQALVSHIYSKGLYGIKINNSKAMYWREIFANNFTISGEKVLSWNIDDMIADSYKKGLGLPKNEEKYKYHLELSKNLNDCKIVRNCINNKTDVIVEQLVQDYKPFSKISKVDKNLVKKRLLKSLKTAVPTLCANMNYCQCKTVNDGGCPKQPVWPPN